MLFSGDNDTVTMGWVSLTSVLNQDIVITQMTADEVTSSSPETGSYLEVEQRVNKTLKRTDLLCPWLAKVVEPTNDIDIQTLPFQEFRKINTKPKLFYRDIFSPKTFATIAEEISYEDFERQGGNVVVLK